ncbi:hypothetical protein COCC4DRAFT_170236 [Bipolaris maydis ATCC 48331]|uniref:Terpene synthase n=2 Tax=Cochliobolus heterostrophus TaxID=5016 RepID=M2T5I5_COCH5|nr:uncharacterized protein COCC4DRAFT_170236 [Bipolaris maydis ATCC 48331]EMD92825.1 hypothetical protein COCHEDRAFT_1223571 [Bipolaris maydis C5]ENI04786.1 hypothetical protein COCC4DRAFT_170236 [Bipolaris maydis ATCC 48331]KAJ6196219.1 isoprenoid synthase domain-containing protein [Bipolaris maydis]KAJ6208319.1 isoprenoid synthase domain-containing protein [Bipolaris maydis]
MEAQQSIDLASFNSKDHNDFLWPINYSYDHMPKDQPPLPSLIDVSSFPDLEAESINVKSVIDMLTTQTEYSIPNNDKLNANSIPIFPVNARLPWHSSIRHLRQSMHWQTAVDAIKALLQHFASDPTATTTMKEGGRSFAAVAAKELPMIEDNWARFSAYLWPAASGDRLKIIAETLVYIFIFDDVWEMNGEDKAQFVSNLEARAHFPDDESASDLQKAMNATIQGLYDEDSIAGNGGVDVAIHLINFINHPPPPATFASLREFLDYRVIDAAALYIVACAKFSLCSTVDLDSPRIAKFIRLLCDHASIVNDLGSFDKEKYAYVHGKVCYMVNTVNEVRKTYALDSDEAAKFVTLALQMEVEQEMVRELARLNTDASVTEAEREFVDALMLSATGSIITSVVMSRYGGKEYAIVAP